MKTIQSSEQINRNFGALRALLGAASKELYQNSTADGLANCSILAAARRAVEELETELECHRKNVGKLVEAVDWTVGDIEAAEETGETSIDIDTLKARLTILS